jgi:hypothetical protein
MYKMMQEQHSRNPEKKRKSVFTMSHNSGDMGGVAVLKHRVDTAFFSYHKNYPYVEGFAEIVGNGDKLVGATRVPQSVQIVALLA